MLFRNKEGLLVEINRYDCKNDSIYYNKVSRVKNLLNTFFEEKKEQDNNSDCEIIFTSYSNKLVKGLIEKTFDNTEQQQ
jgi:predicted ATP-dependent endonuclease of OLD family